jgi:uncharacterized protein YdeI (YjbR/CyaY-like superfamily)
VEGSCAPCVGRKYRTGVLSSRSVLCMAPVVPDPRTIKTFRTEPAFESWMRKNHAREDEVWLRIYKKDAGVPSITIAEALDVALCWGWIDGLRKAFDERSFLQRYTPRRAKSMWSQVNRGHVARLTKAGRMTPHGQRQVDAAKADGRWGSAYAPMRGALDDNFPNDLRKAIEANPRARKTFQSLGRQNLYALAFRTSNMKTPAGRARKIAALVDMLDRGETPYPERR